MRIKPNPKQKRGWEWGEVVLYTTKWYSLPTLLTWLNIAAVEGWFYGAAHHWHETSFVGSNLVLGNMLLLVFTLVEWAYRGDNKKYWNDGTSTYYDNRAHEIVFYVLRRRNKDG